MPIALNDVHSGLNASAVAAVLPVASTKDIRSALQHVRRNGGALAVSGGRHAMGGQQFLAGQTVIDMRPLKRVLAFDRERGRIEVDAGIEWPELVAYLLESQHGVRSQWGIRQKQTGADRFTIGGSVSANCHGRGLALPPISSDVESICLVQADAGLVECSRRENAELFRLALGGYGLFGVISSVVLRLAPRRKLERVVELLSVPQLIAACEDRIAHGFVYGDFQFAVDPDSPTFLDQGVFSCYRPVAADTPIPRDQRALTRADWRRLLLLAHTDKARAFDEYARHYLATSGQLYWSDLHQFADYSDGYHVELDRVLRAPVPASEVIGEVYVPRRRLADFMAAAAEDFRRYQVDVVYGTIRLIERDDDTFLAWAKQAYACVIFNLHTRHSDEGIAASAGAFRRLTDLAIERDGSYFLTYHRWATREQLESCYPQFADFVALKQRHDPGELLRSDWYDHYAGRFARRAE